MSIFFRSGGGTVRRLPLILLLSACASDPIRSDTDPAGPTGSWWTTVHTRIEADDRAFRADDDRAFRADGGAWRVNLHRSAGHLDGSGLTVTQGDGTFTVRTVRAGRADTLGALPATVARSGACTRDVDPSGACVRRVELPHDDTLTEWWHTTAAGYEQGWDLAAAPAGTGDVVVDVVIDAQALHATDAGATFVDSAGNAWRWAEASAVDAAGRALPVRITLTPEHALRLAVDDHDAVYPIVIDPLLTPLHPAAAVTGTGGEGLGYAVDSAGDVNADGYADIVVGAPNAAGGDGRAYVFLGSSTGVATVAVASLVPPSAAAHFGASVAGIGDTDGDGYGDLAVGGPDASGGRGVVVVYAGRAGGPDTSAAATWTGATTGSALGAALAGADFDGDGYADLAAGAPGSGGSAGIVSLYAGSGGGLTPATTLTGAAGDHFGSALAAGSLTGDTYADLAVGAPDEGDGRVRVYRGGASGLNTTATATLSGSDPGGRFGAAVGAAGDIDADGNGDLLVGAPDAGGGAGRAFLYMGRASGPNSFPLLTVSGGAPGEQLGAAVDGAGDVNADGYADLVLGAPGSGAVYVYNGSVSGPFGAPAATFVGATDFGFALGGAGDVNGDSYDDVVVGSDPSGDGRVDLLTGSDGGLRWSTGARIFGASADALGSGVTAVGDVDHDGYADVVVGAPGYAGSTGRAYLYRGAATGLTTTAATTWTGAASGDLFGTGVAGVGDVDGDGEGDLVIGAPGVSGSTGAAYLYLGTTSGPATTPTSTLPGTLLGGSFGGIVAPAGDLNADGHADLAIGAPNYSSNRGRVYVFLGTSGGYGSTADMMTGGNTSEYAGFAIAGDVDVNHDGYDDLLVGGYGYNSSQGRVRLYLGSAAGVTSVASQTLTGAASSAFGSGIAGLTDVNGDGYDDIVVGAGTEGLIGAAHLYLGTSTGVASTATTDWTGPGVASGFGARVAPAGDVNADGYPDLLIASPGFASFTGRVDLYHGTATGPETTASTTLQGDATGSYYGLALGPAGDIDGDTYDDILVGAPYQTGGDGRFSVHYGYDIDDDADGTVAGADCDDHDAATAPGSVEVCDGADNDCNGAIDDGAVDPATWYADTDADGYGNPASTTTACDLPAGFVADATDCDDGAAAIHPGATEVCNGIDDDCDGTTDEGATDASTWYTDADGDTYGDPTSTTAACAAPPGTVVDATDCDDTAAAVHPGAAEVCNGIDDDCDGSVDTGAIDAPTWHRDSDADGYGDPAATTTACTAPAGYVADLSDCDDTRANVNPAELEVCDGLDNDCDTSVDEGATDAATWYADADGDTYGDPAAPQRGCTRPAGYVADATDCDDTRGIVYPGAPEVCDGLDDDCDGAVDEAATDAPTWYTDADGDSYGDPTRSVTDCAAPAGTVADDTDCNDADAAYHPGAPEACDDPYDYNCDGVTTYADRDGDGVAACEDCDDLDASALPGGTEVCDGVDNDCNGSVDDAAADAPTWYADRDGDGYGDSRIDYVGCAAPPGYVATGGDCDDGDRAVSPGAAELCDGVDNDCDSLVDEEAVDTSDWYADTDGDGYGDPAEAATACDSPRGYVADATDCDDGDATIHPDAPESCELPIDNNCDGEVGYADTDDDGAAACEDCDDHDAAAFPGNPEVCDGIDNDCNGAIDDGLSTGTWYTDADGDGYGDPATAVTDCAQPDATIEDGTDCDDTRADAFPGNPEVCDDVDNDCDGYADAIRYEGGVWSICDDQDGDGLIDYDEVSHFGTDPVQADTDHGGVNDGDEVANNTDPLDPTDDVEETVKEAEGCGCASAPSPGVGLALALAGMWMGRRRARPSTR